MLAGVTAMDGPVAVQIWVYEKRPESRERKSVRGKTTWKATGKDADNLAKAVCDALNGIAYADDKQVCLLNVRKYEHSDASAVVVRVSNVTAQSMTLEYIKRLNICEEEL